VHRILTPAQPHRGRCDSAPTASVCREGVVGVPKRMCHIANSACVISLLRAGRAAKGSGGVWHRCTPLRPLAAGVPRPRSPRGSGLCSSSMQACAMVVAGSENSGRVGSRTGRVLFPCVCCVNALFCGILSSWAAETPRTLTRLNNRSDGTRLPGTQRAATDKHSVLPGTQYAASAAATSSRPQQLCPCCHPPCLPPARAARTPLSG
jgi:hypothetical protein